MVSDIEWILDISKHVLLGHSHRKMILDIGDGIKYINNPLGYVIERETGLIEPPHELYEINLD